MSHQRSEAEIDAIAKRFGVPRDHARSAPAGVLEYLPDPAEPPVPLSETDHAWLLDVAQRYVNSGS